MTEKIVVTDAQVKAAQMIVDHDRAVGRETDEATRKIAEAKPEPMTGDRPGGATGTNTPDAVDTASGPSAPPLAVAEPADEQPGARPSRARAPGSSGKFVLKKGSTGDSISISWLERPSHRYKRRL